MRNKTLMLLVSMMLAFMSLSAQELAVKSFTHVPNDLSAQTNERLDLNGKPCALLKISVRDDIVNAVGSIIGNIENKGVTKWIYTTSRAPQIKLEFQYSFPLTIRFADYGYQYLDGYQTYEVVLVDALLSAIASQQTQPQVQAPVVQQSQVQQSQVQQVQPQVPAESAVSSNSMPAQPYNSLSSANGIRPSKEISNPVIRRLVENMVRVEGGTFMMGATSEQGRDAYDNEKPAHRVTLSDYYIGRYEVTQEEWKAVMGSNPSRVKGAKHPVENISWNDCQEFVKRLNQLTGLRFRLPTEAEWEYAARGGNKSRGYKYAGNKKIKIVAWYSDNSDEFYYPVGQKQANELGLYDMSGNVFEWCQDRYDSYSSDSQTNPTGPFSGYGRVFRGGSYFTNAWNCRVSRRSIIPFSSDASSGHDLGLRLAL